jgi:hypothetical protein
MKQVALFSTEAWRTLGHVKNLCPAPKSATHRFACNGHVGFDLGLDHYVCRVCGQMSTFDEVKGLEPWRGEL